MNRLGSLWREAASMENYLLLARGLRAARLVRRHLPGETPSPALAESIRAAEAMRLARQPDWALSDPMRIARLAALLVRVPSEWGRCVQRSLIAYRLLNGYGYPARIVFGIRKDSRGNDDLTRDGHAWVVRLDEPRRAFAESPCPGDRYRIIYASPE